MYTSNARHYAELRQYLDGVPVIETHEHQAGYIEVGTDPVDYVMGNYYGSDFISAGGDEGFLPWCRSDEVAGLSPEAKCERFLQTYRKSDKTAFARCVQESVRQNWGIESIDSVEALQALGEKLKGRNVAMYDAMMERLGIKAAIADIYDLGAFSRYVEGKQAVSKHCRLSLPLPSFHNLHSKNDVLSLQRVLGGPITCLDDYVERFDAFFRKCIDFGIVALKDQSAYRRSLACAHPAKAEAEKAFNNIVLNPKDTFGDDAVRPLDDWLFQHFMRKAAAYDMPVQLHTGYNRGDIAKAEAALLIPLIELNPDVRFALFHGNWPNMDSYLFMGKNFPNVCLDLCWVQCVDPPFCVELMKRAVTTMPHSKLFAFGGDIGVADWVAGYLTLARDTVACALSELVDGGWIGLDEARQIAKDWFFNNPNEFYRLGFPRI